MANSSITLTSLASTLGISSLTEDTTPDIAADFIPSYDASASANKKIKLVNIPGAGMVFLSTATAANSASIAFTGLTSAYKEYRIVMNHILPATDNTNLCVRTSTDGGSNYDGGAADYAWAINGYQAGAAGAYDDSDALIRISGMTQNLSSTAGEHYSGVLNIYTPSSAAMCEINGLCQFRGSSSNYFSTCTFAGRRLTAADVDAIQFYMASGNIASGTFTLYGLK